jgi:tetratricopeptide (TPR) repeat protein
VEGSGLRADLLIVDAFSSDSIPVHLLTIEALRAYLRAVGDGIVVLHISNQYADLRPILGAAALELGLNTEALECFEQAVEKNPMLPTARNNIGNLLKDRARGMDALPQYRKSMELNPDDRDAPSNYLLCHMYIPDMDPKLVFEEHKKWGLSTTKKFPPAFKFKPRAVDAKIRLGFLSLGRLTVGIVIVF